MPRGRKKGKQGKPAVTVKFARTEEAQRLENVRCLEKAVSEVMSGRKGERVKAVLQWNGKPKSGE